MPSYFYLIFAFYILSFACLIATSYKKSLFRYRIFAKALTSVSFVATAWCSGAASGNSQLFARLLPAFALCLVGDILLAMTSDDGAKKAFILGLLAFLTGHFLFAVGFDFIVPFKLSELILPLAGVPVALGFLKLERMKTGSMKNYILAYSFFVSLLLSKGISVFILAQNAFGLMVLCGSVLFLISDFILLFLYFYEDKHPLTCFVNLLCYYLATFLLAFSIYFYRS